jgi:hypothetical protein
MSAMQRQKRSVTEVDFANKRTRPLPVYYISDSLWKQVGEKQ